MVKCCVPGCNARRVPLHSVPFTSGFRWQLWLLMCPFLRNKQLQLENVKICRRHFIPEHIKLDNDCKKGKLTKDSYPLLNLPNCEKLNKDSKILEISPLQSKEPVKIVNVATHSLSTQTNNMSNCDRQLDIESENEELLETHLVRLKADDKHGLPGDHNMYCLPSQVNERPPCLSSPCVMCQTSSKKSEDHPILSIDTGQEPGVHHATPLQDVTVDCLPGRQNQQSAEPLPSNAECSIKTAPVAKETIHNVDAQSRTRIKEKRISGALRLNSQTDTAEQCMSTRHNEQRPYSLSADVDQSLKESLLNPQFITSDDVNGMHNNVHLLPTNTVSDESAQTYSQNPANLSSIYLTQNIFNQLTSESPLQKETLKSIHKLFSDFEEHHNVPFNHVLTESSQTSKLDVENSSGPNNQSQLINLPFNHVLTESSQRSKTNTESAGLNNRSQLNIQRIVMKPAGSVAQPLQRKPKEQYLESLVAEFTESVNVEETEVLRSPAVIPAKTPICMQNPTCVTGTFTPMRDPISGALNGRKAFNMEVQRVCLNKDKCTPKELMLHMQNKKLKMKLKAGNQKRKRLESKIDSTLAITKQFLKGYPLLTRETKALIDTQLRLTTAKTVKATRYSEEDKLFALRLYQISPECYRFLTQYLKLPTKSTLRNFIKN